LQQLMTYGLLRGAFRPTEDVCVLRALWHQRGMLLRGQGRQVQHMQKALALLAPSSNVRFLPSRNVRC